MISPHESGHFDQNPRWNSLNLCQDLGITFSDEPTLAPAATTAPVKHVGQLFCKNVPFGKRLHNYGKSQFFMGKTNITMERSTMLLMGKLTISTGPCSIANCYSHYQRVVIQNLGKHLGTILDQCYAYSCRSFLDGLNWKSCLAGSLPSRLGAQKRQYFLIWLVVTGTFGLFFHICIYIYIDTYIHNYWECHHPSWRTPSFFRGVSWSHQPLYVFVPNRLQWYLAIGGILVSPISKA